MRKLSGIVTVMVGIWMGMPGACLSEQPAADSVDGALTLDAVTEIGDLSQAMFGLADKDDWDPFFDKFNALNQATDVLDAEMLTDREKKLVLSKCITDLEEAAAARDALGAMQATNQITLIAADLSDQFDPQTSSDVARLAYYSRELRIDAEEKDARRLQLTAESLQETWKQLRPKVARRIGGPVAAKRIDALVQQVQAAESPDQYEAVVAPLLDEVKLLKKLFAE